MHFVRHLQFNAFRVTRPPVQELIPFETTA
jgi:hypothetical protein